MPKAASALPGAEYQGYVSVKEAGLRGMITLRGDLGSAEMARAVSDVSGCEFPDQGQISLKGNRGVAWMSPDELLLLGPYGKAQAEADHFSRLLAGGHHLVANVSDARAVFTLSGKGARDVLAKLSPADVSEAGFAKGQMRRSRLAQVPAAFWISGRDRVDLMCFRSVATYVFGLLQQSAQPGSEVGFL